MEDSVITTTVVPILGCLVNSFVYVSPALSVARAYRGKDVDNLNADPFTLYFCNGIAWLLYSCMLGDIFIFVANCLAPLPFLYYSIALAASEQSNTPYHTRAVALSSVCLTLLVVLGGILAFLPDRVAALALSAWFANVVAVLGFASPLSTAVAVVRRRDSQSLDTTMIIATLLNTSLWSTYGLAIDNAFVWVPNVLCFTAGVLQLALKILFHRGQCFGIREGLTPDTDDGVSHISEILVSQYSGTCISEMDTAEEQPAPGALEVSSQMSELHDARLAHGAAQRRVEAAEKALQAAEEARRDAAEPLRHYHRGPAEARPCHGETAA